jgi:hypothetical protein
VAFAEVFQVELVRPPTEGTMSHRALLQSASSAGASNTVV